MTSTRRLALAAGVFYLLTFAFSIPAYFLYEPVLTDPGYIVGSGGADTRIILGGDGEGERQEVEDARRERQSSG